MKRITIYTALILLIVTDLVYGGPPIPLAGWGTNRIVDGDSSVIVTDTGTGSIVTTIDGVVVSTATASGVAIGTLNGTSIALTTLSTMPNAYSISVAGGFQVYIDTTLAAAKHLVLPLHDDATTPTLAFGDGDTGFYEFQDDSLGVAIVGVKKWQIGPSIIGLYAPGRSALLTTIGSATAPNVVPNYYNDADTGIGWAAADILSLIAGGTNGLNVLSSGNIGIGTTNAFGGGGGVLAIATCTTEPYSVTAGAGTLYYTNNEMWVANGAITKTQLSTHPESGYVDLDLPTYHGFRSKIPLLGKEVSGDITATVAAVERLMKQVFGEDVKYQTFSDLPASERITPEQYFASMRTVIEKKLREDLSTEVEVSLDDATEIIQVDIDKEIEVLEQFVDKEGKTRTRMVKRKVIESETLSYKFKDGKIKEVKTPVYKKTKISKIQLKVRHRLDAETGKLYRKQLPLDSLLSAAVAVEMGKVKLPKYVADKLGL